MTDTISPSQQLADLIGEDNARAAIQAAWDAIRRLNADRPTVDPGVGDYVATVAVLAAVPVLSSGGPVLTAETVASLRRQLDDARTIVDAAAYDYAAQDCHDGECDHLSEAAYERGEKCPVVETRYATAADLLAAQDSLAEARDANSQLAAALTEMLDTFNPWVSAAHAFKPWLTPEHVTRWRAALNATGATNV